MASMGAPPGAAMGKGIILSALVAEAEQLISRFEPAQALQRLQQAYARDNNNPKVLDLLGQCFLELGDSKNALQALQQSVKLSPTGGHSKWMYLGQLLNGHEALQCFQKGAALVAAERQQMRAKLDHAREAAKIDSRTAQSLQANIRGLEEETRSLDKALSTAYCAMAELFVTDLCDEKNAESECERVLQLAVGSCATNPDAFYALVNLRLIQGRHQDANRYLERCLRLIKSQMEERPEDAVGYDLFVSAGKACLELQHHTEAVDLFEHALASDDRVVEAWYLTAFAYLKAGEPSAAKQYALRAQQMLSRSPEPELGAALQELMQELQRQPTQSQSQPLPVTTHPAAASSTDMDTDNADGM